MTGVACTRPERSPSTTSTPQPDPRAYFSTLRELDYRIPQLAKPYFSRLIDELPDVARRVRPPPCSTSAAPTASTRRCCAATPPWTSSTSATAARTPPPRPATRCWPATGRWSGPQRARRSAVRRPRRVRRRAVVRARGRLPRRRRARRPGAATTRPSEQREQLAGADLVISTGCLGYVTEQTIARVVAGPAASASRGWRTSCCGCSRSSPSPECLAGLGYDDRSRVERVFRQRRFASPRGAGAGARHAGRASGVDPRGLESRRLALRPAVHLSRTRARSVTARSWTS